MCAATYMGSQRIIDFNLLTFGALCLIDFYGDCKVNLVSRGEEVNLLITHYFCYLSDIIKVSLLLEMHRKCDNKSSSHVNTESFPSESNKKN